MVFEVLEGAFVQVFCFLVYHARLAVRLKHRSSITFLVCLHCSFKNPPPHFHRTIFPLDQSIGAADQIH